MYDLTLVSDQPLPAAMADPSSLRDEALNLPAGHAEHATVLDDVNEPAVQLMQPCAGLGDTRLYVPLLQPTHAETVVVGA